MLEDTSTTPTPIPVDTVARAGVRNLRSDTEKYKTEVMIGLSCMSAVIAILICSVIVLIVWLRKLQKYVEIKRPGNDFRIARPSRLYGKEHLRQYQTNDPYATPDHHTGEYENPNFPRTHENLNFPSPSSPTRTPDAPFSYANPNFPSPSSPKRTPDAPFSYANQNIGYGNPRQQNRNDGQRPVSNAQQVNPPWKRGPSTQQGMPNYVNRESNFY